jgi:hypothetical protein
MQAAQQRAAYLQAAYLQAAYLLPRQELVPRPQRTWCLNVLQAPPVPDLRDYVPPSQAPRVILPEVPRGALNPKPSQAPRVILPEVPRGNSASGPAKAPA